MRIQGSRLNLKMWSLSNVSSQFFCFIFLLRTRFSIELKEGAIVIKYSLVSQLAFELFARRVATDV